MLSQQVDSLVVAALMGHVETTMLSILHRHYQNRADSMSADSDNLVLSFSFPSDGLIQIQQDAGGGDPGCGFVGSGTADCVCTDKLFRFVRVSSIPVASDRQQIRELPQFVFARWSGDAQSNGVSEEARVIRKRL